MAEYDGIEIRNLEVSYGALGRINLDIPRGAVTGIIGKNGAGKSTLLRVIAGIIGYTGIVRLSGKEISALTRAERQKIGYVGGDRCLPKELTVKKLKTVLKNMFSEWEDDTFAALTEKFEIPLSLPIGEFSTGMAARTALAAALSHCAELLLLDEPFGGLDPAAREKTLDIIYDFMQDERHTVVITSHITGELARLCDRAVFMRGGRIILDGEKDELLGSYAVVLGKCDKALAVDERAYGTRSLVRVCDVPPGAQTERVTLDELAVFLSEGENE